MTWLIDIHSHFLDELREYDISVKKSLFVKVKLLEEFGPRLNRPHVDTLVGSQYANMKELRFNSNNGVWRIAFTFDPNRKGILLVGGEKSGMSQRLFYKTLIHKEDERFKSHLREIREEKSHAK